jgi:hypothetical protein
MATFMDLMLNTKPVQDWSTDDVCAWLEGNDFPSDVTARVRGM